MSTAEETLEGSCLCGRVRYRVRGPLGAMSNCHCTDCRKSHGAAFATYADAPRTHFTFLAGEDQLETYRAGSGTKRSFCRICGSTLVCFSDDDPATIEIAAGALDTPLHRRPEYHIFVRSRVPWYEIRDDRPQHQAYPEKK